MKKKIPRVSVQIINWNGKRFLKDCFDSLLKQNYPNFELVLVDNCSGDGSIDFMEKNYTSEIKRKKIRIFSLDKNYGFAEGYNRSYKKTKADYVLLINNDTKSPDVNLISIMVKRAESDKNIANVGGVTFAFGTDLRKQKVEKIGGLSLLITNVIDNPIKDRIFYTSGCCCLIKKNLVRELFDGDYFAYCEDVYLGWKINLLGYKNVLEPRARILHYGSGTAGTGSPFVRYYGERNRILNCLIFYDSSTLIKIMPLMALYSAVSGLFFLQRPKVFLGYLQAYAWILSHPFKIIQKRRQMQKIRVISDKEILKMLSCKIFLTEPKITSFYDSLKKSLLLDFIRKTSLVLDNLSCVYCKIMRIPVFDSFKNQASKASK